MEKGKYQNKDFEKDHLNKFQELIGEVENGEFVNIKVHVKKYKDTWYVDCRQWMNKPGSFVGPLKKGFQLTFEEFEKFKEIIKNLDTSKYGDKILY